MTWAWLAGFGIGAAIFAIGVLTGMQLERDRRH
jgi:hypothetical protein